MSGITRCEERDVWIIASTRRNTRQLVVQTLRVAQLHDSLDWIILIAKSFTGQMLDEPLPPRRRRTVVSREEALPEHGKKPVSPKPGRDQQPHVQPVWIFTAEPRHGLNPGA